MEAIGTSSFNQITQQAATQTSYGLFASADLNVKTEEGDLVKRTCADGFHDIFLRNVLINRSITLFIDV